MARSIIEQARAEGYREGLYSITQVQSDEDYARGQTDAYAEAPRRWRWFVFGFLVCAALVWWLS